MPFIEVIEHAQAEGQLKEVYDDLVSSRGKLASVHKIQSLNPESIVRHIDLYMTIMFGRSPLKRAQREMIAVVVSQANGCAYCIQHHAEALNHFWKDAEKLAAFNSDYRQVELAAPDRALCDFAWQLTRNPDLAKEAWVAELTALGLDDRSILDATLVIAYFNFVNRIVMGLGVDLEQEGAGGYKYE